MQKASWAVVAIACVGALGCKNAGGGPAGKAAEEAGGVDEAAVLDLYVECFNEVDHRVHDSWASYVGWVDPDKGLTGKEKTIDGITGMDDYHTGKCLTNLQEAVTKGGANGPLVAQTKAQIAAMQALLPVVAETKTYYERKDYKDDAFAKGKELHGKLVAAFDGYKQASAALRSAWDTRHRASRDSELAKLEKKQGRQSEQFLTSQVMNTGEALIETLSAGAPVEALRTAIATYQAAFAEMDKFFGPALTASTDTDRYIFKQEAEKLLIQTKEAVRALDGKQALPKEGDGSEAKLLDGFNDLVERSNSITWD